VVASFSTRRAGIEHRFTPDLLLEHHDPVEQPFGPRRAAGDVDHRPAMMVSMPCTML